MLHRFRAARAADKASAAAPAPTPAPAAPPAAPATVESLGAQLRETLPARRLQSVSLCDHEANVLWLSEGALGPDEHMLVMEALEILKGDSSLPCHETALEDGRLGVFLPVRAPTGALVGVAMILADSKSVGDDTLERLTAAPIRTIMQRLAVLLKPNGTLAPVAPIAVEVPEEVSEASGEVTELTFEPEPPEAEPAEPVKPVAVNTAPEAPVQETATVIELSLVPEVEAPPPVPAPPAATPAPEDDADLISAVEIANILELELAPEELQVVGSKPAAADAPPVAVAAVAAIPVAAPPPPAPPVLSAAPEEDEDLVADSGMLRLEFLAEPPVVLPAQNPTAVARKLQAASKAAEVAPTRAPRALPRPAVRAAPAPAAASGVVPAKSPAPAPAARPTPVDKPAPAAPAANGKAPPAGAARNPFEPLPAHSHLSLNAKDDDVLVLFDSDPPAKAPPAPQAAAPAKPVAAQAKPVAVAAKPVAAPPKPAAVKPVQPAQAQPAAKTTSPPRAAPAVRTVPPPLPVAATPAPPAAVAAVAPAPAASAAQEPAPALDLIPFARLRAGGQNRRFQVQPRGATAQRDPAADELLLQELLTWLGSHRALWASVPTSFTVNISVATLEDERFLGKVAAALNTHGISADTLGFEIAESLCAQQRAKVERFIAQCEKIGAWVVIDDFSFDSQVLPLLRSKALRLLKLDARLSAAALRDKLSQAVLVATVQAAKVLGIHCSAKKTDSQASLQYLTAIGLDYAQGTALGGAVPVETIGSLPQ